MNIKTAVHTPRLQTGSTKQLDGKAQEHATTLLGGSHCQLVAQKKKPIKWFDPWWQVGQRGQGQINMEATKEGKHIFLKKKISTN